MAGFRFATVTFFRLRAFGFDGGGKHLPTTLYTTLGTYLLPSFSFCFEVRAAYWTTAHVRYCNSGKPQYLLAKNEDHAFSKVLKLRHSISRDSTLCLERGRSYIRNPNMGDRCGETQGTDVGLAEGGGGCLSQAIGVRQGSPN